MVVQHLTVANCCQFMLHTHDVVGTVFSQSFDLSHLVELISKSHDISSWAFTASQVTAFIQRNDKVFVPV